MAIQATHTGDFLYQVETSYGNGFTAIQTQIPADSIESVNFTPSMNIQRLPTISDYIYKDTTMGAHDYTITVANPFQRLGAAAMHTQATCLENLAVTRTASDLSSIACAVKTGTGSYLIFKGGKINTQSLAFSVGEQVNVTTEIWASNLMTSGSAPTGTAPTAIGTAFDTFNSALVAKGVKWSLGIKACTLTINNNLERIPRIATAGAQGGDYAFVMPGIQEITVKADIIADAAGKADIDDMLSGEESSITIQTGTTASYSLKWVLNRPTQNSVPVVYTADMKTLVLSADIGAEYVTFSVVP